MSEKEVNNPKQSKGQDRPVIRITCSLPRKSKCKIFPHYSFEYRDFFVFLQQKQNDAQYECRINE